MKRLTLSLLSSLFVLATHAQAVVVNEYLNESSASSEFVELKVLTDRTDLRGYVLRDFTGAGNVGGTITFSNDVLWADVRASYRIVIEVGQSPSSDTDFSDGVVTVGEDDATYFSTASTFSIGAARDGVQLLDDGGSHVHILYHGNPAAGSLFEAAAAMSPGAKAGSTLGTGEVARFFDTDEPADFDDDANAENSATVTKGAPNDAVQAAFCAGLLPVWINEIDADRNLPSGPPEGSEFIELAGPAGFGLTGFAVEIYRCAGGTATLERTETITSFILPDDPGVDGWGFFVLAGPTLFDSNVDQVFGGAGTDVLDDVAGIVVLKNAAGREVFDFRYDVAVPAQCPATYATRTSTDAPGGITMGFVAEEKPSDTASASNTMTATVGRPNSGQVLPVELTAFEAVLDGADALLRWTTASETNNAGFEIQHAGPILEQDPQLLPPNPQIPSWESLGFAPGHGTTVEAQVYAFRAADLAPGLHRFRLRQLDYDGTFAYSPEVEVAVGVPGAFRLSAPYPNPFAGRVQLALSVARAQHVAVEVFDAAGRRVATLFDGALPANTTRALTLDGAALPAGLYLIRASGDFFDTSRAVLRLR